MTRWILEPGHTSAEFVARHMMVTKVRGLFTGIEGALEFDPEDPTSGSVEAVIAVGTLWTGEEDRDAHLKSEDFLHVGEHPTITYRGDRVERLGATDFRVFGELTIRGVTREVPLDVSYLGSWETPYWADGEDKGPVRRAGFTATTAIDRQEFGVSWNSALDHGGVVVGDEVRITLDAEALESGIVPGV